MTATLRTGRSSALLLVLCGLLLEAPTASAHGGLGLEFQVNTVTGNRQDYADVDGHSDGGFQVVWQSAFGAGSIQSRRFDASGNPASPDFQVNTYQTGTPARPRIGISSSGAATITWEHQNDIAGQRYDAFGVAVGGEFAVSAYSASELRPAVALDASGGAIITWSSLGTSGSDVDNFSVQARRYDSNGDPVGPRFQVNTSTTGPQLLSDVSIAADSTAVIVWNDDASFIQGQRYDSGGNAAGSEFLVGSVAGSYSYALNSRPSVAHGASGEFIVAWRGLSGGPIALTILGQRYDSSGDASGGIFEVNDGFSLGRHWTEQDAPDVSTGPLGNFLISWSARDTIGQGGGAILGQRYDSGGTPVGANFEVSAYAFDSSRNPSVSFDGNGQFTVVWQADPGSGYEIFGRRSSFPNLPSLGAFGLLGLAAFALVAGVRSLHPRGSNDPKA